jgi:hypothetical protein
MFFLPPLYNIYNLESRATHILQLVRLSTDSGTRINDVDKVSKSKVKISLLQAMEAHRVARG